MLKTYSLKLTVRATVKRWTPLRVQAKWHSNSTALYVAWNTSWNTLFRLQT